MSTATLDSVSSASSIAPVDRHGSPLAPGGLALVHSLLNTRAAGSRCEDQLLELSTARAWLAETLIVWADRKAVEVPHLELTAHDLPPLRKLRDGIESMLLAGRRREASFTARLDLTMTADAQVTVHPRGRQASDWMRSAVLAECLAAQLTSVWPRLKLCANPECNAAFYDRSKNRSGVWHDVHVCGNRHNLRASRARRRGGGLG